MCIRVRFPAHLIYQPRDYRAVQGHCPCDTQLCGNESGIVTLRLKKVACGAWKRDKSLDFELRMVVMKNSMPAWAK